MRMALAAAASAISLAACTQGGSAPDLGPGLNAGRETFNSVCAACHGGNGQGGSAPALTEVVETFSICADQIEWISLGSERYQEEVGPTYGDQDKEITAVMPEFGKSLSESEIAQVAAFERHQFGGDPEATARSEFGL